MSRAAVRPDLGAASSPRARPPHRALAGPIALDIGWALKDPALELRESLTGTGAWDAQNRTKLHLSIGYF